jgi:hypothetical protein
MRPANLVVAQRSIRLETAHLRSGPAGKESVRIARRSMPVIRFLVHNVDTRLANSHVTNLDTTVTLLGTIRIE